MYNHSSTFQARVTRFIVGDAKLPTFHKVHHLLILLTSLFDATSALFNALYLTVSPIYNMILLVVAGLLIVVWFQSRFKNRFKSMARIYVANMFLFALPLNWFMNGGVDGPTLAFIYISVIYSIVVLSEIGALNSLAILGMVGMTVTLIIVEYIFPDTVFRYANETARMQDLVFSNIASLSVLIAMMMVYTRMLRREVNRANSYAHELEMLNNVDMLTKVKSRHFSMHALELAEKHQQSFHVIMLDIDNFKLINDRFGHDVGDSVLKAVSAIVKTQCQQNGALVSRHGGEEFLVITFFQSWEQTVELAQDIRRALAMCKIGEAGSVTISSGVTSHRETETHKETIRRADKALYESKHNGRNLVTVAQLAE